MIFVCVSCFFFGGGEKHLGESIDFYVAMNMDGISELNDLAGGVTVTFGG